VAGSKGDCGHPASTAFALINDVSDCLRQFSIPVFDIELNCQVRRQTVAACN
jgi:hypothetical protein